MKHLKTFSDPQYPESWYKNKTREAARVVMMDENWLFPIIYAENFDYYKIPGGWIDEWENTLEAAKREAMEECWCEVAILWEVWEIDEKKWATNYKWEYNIHQISYCFYGKIISKWDTNFSWLEIKEWFKLLWLSYDEAIEKFTHCKPQHNQWIFMNNRDKIFLEEWYKLLTTPLHSSKA